MSQIKETRAKVTRVGFEVEHVVDLVRRRIAPSFKFVEDVEYIKHSISVGGKLEGADVKIICHPSKIWM